MAKPKLQILCFFLFVISIFLCLFHGESSELDIDDESWLNEEDNEVIMVQSHHDSRNKCDFSTGKWVYDQSYPLYDTNCPYLSTAVTCQRNGRPDSNYEKWKWKPQGCSIPRYMEKMCKLLVPIIYKTYILVKLLRVIIIFYANCMTMSISKICMILLHILLHFVYTLQSQFFFFLFVIFLICWQLNPACCNNVQVIIHIVYAKNRVIHHGTGLMHWIFLEG